MTGSIALAPQQALPRMEARAAVETALRYFDDNLGDQELSLARLAGRVRLSRFQLIRAFQTETGVTPAKFLFGLRMRAAKDLLLRTERSVTDICFDVGYNGLGTFVSRFSAAVGLPPNQFRLFSRSRTCMLPLIDRIAAGEPLSPLGVNGTVRAPAEFFGLVFIGCFDSPLPEAAPTSCAVTVGAAPFRLAGATDSVRRVFAIGAPWRDLEATLLGSDAVWRASVVPSKGGIEITLRPPQPLDPPVVVCLPALLSRGRSLPKLLA